MKLKTFHAKTMAEAMKQVRETLGDDAIIVNTRDEPTGWVKVTAAAEAREEPPAPPPVQEEDALDLVTETLLRQRVPANVAEKIIASTPIAPAQKALSAALKKTFKFAPLGKSIILVGPPGAGKTLSSAKLAARAVLAGRKPTVITTDTTRAGGVEQLSAFLDILKLPLGVASDAASLKQVLSPGETIIDTGGLNPFDPKEMASLAKILQVANAEAVLVLPAGMDAEEAAETALTFSVLGVKKLLPTRLDFARRIGGILSAADRAGLSFAEASHTPQVADGLLPLDADNLAHLLLPRKK